MVCVDHCDSVRLVKPVEAAYQRKSHKSRIGNGSNMTPWDEGTDRFDCRTYGRVTYSLKFPPPAMTIAE